MPAYNPKFLSNEGRRFSNTMSNDPAENKSAERGFMEKNRSALAAMLCQPLFLLIVFVPMGIYAGVKEFSAPIVFSCNFVAIVPLAGILGASTEALSMHTGQMMGGLLNATFGNAVEMIVTINAIKAGLVSVVQDSLIGSILSNLLLVLGMAFMASGVLNKESSFNMTGAAANITCLVLASIALTLPTCFSYIPDTTEENDVALSRTISVVLAIVYVLFLVFQLRTHSDLFIGEEEETEEAEMAMSVAVTILFCATCCVAYCSEFLVHSIEGVREELGLPKTFIGMILLPIVGNAAEHVTAVTAAYKGKMDLALGVAVGSSTQIALFVIPFSVIVGWVVSVPMTLNFEIFSSSVFLLSVFIASSVLGDGHANWLEGAMLCASYCIVGIITWYIPDRLDGEGASSAAAGGVIQEAKDRLLLAVGGAVKQSFF